MEVTEIREGRVAVPKGTAGKAACGCSGQWRRPGGDRGRVTWAVSAPRTPGANHRFSRVHMSSTELFSSAISYKFSV